MAKPTSAGTTGTDGVLLFNLGGPETLADVRPFLYNLFSDPDIIRIRSDVLRKALAWTIAFSRQGKSKGLYRQIGGGSPLRRITTEQAAALEAGLTRRGCPARVYVGMRCWKPSIEEATDRIRADGIRRLVALPLFPQFSGTTTGSCFKHFRSCLQRAGIAASLKVEWVQQWFDFPPYIDAMAGLIEAELSADRPAPAGSTLLLYSAHSIPESYVDAGDPYLEQTRQSVALIDARLGDAVPSRLAFQSKVGPVKWLEPSTVDVIAELGRSRLGRLVVVPVSFVSDHIETLQELDIAYRELALSSGIREFRRVPALNLAPSFIEALADIVEERLRAGA